MIEEGLDEEIPAGTGWHKTRAFGHVAYARWSGDTLWLAIRIGNLPLGIPFSSSGAWAMVDVVVDQPRPT